MPVRPRHFAPILAAFEEQAPCQRSRGAYASNRSISDVIKKHFSAGATGTELHRILDTITVEEETLDRVDELIEERRAHPAGAPEL